MSNKKQRMKNRKTAEFLAYATGTTKICSNCGEETRQGHYFPPSLRDMGGFICSSRALRHD